jgi:hypothetical protein
MRRLGLTASGGDHLWVTVANGDCLRCVWIARDVEESIAGEPYTIMCVGVNLACFDIILRIDFLWTLGSATWDFDARTLNIQRGTHRVLWQAAPSLLELWGGRCLSGSSSSMLPFSTSLRGLPQGLPPACPYDHCIHLLLSTAPIVVRSYRYPQLQKDELER